MSRTKQTYLYITVFVSGLTSLAVEFAASRLLGNYFGSSNLVWASIVGLILIYLTLGYFLGGYWADRQPNYRTFFRILTWGAFLVGLIPVAARPVLRFAANAFDQLELGVLAGSFVTVMVLFIVPITLLGTISPFAIRLGAENTASLGSLSGRIYAISTLGSFAGTFLPTLLLIPLIGTFRTFLVLSAMLLAVAMIGLLRECGWRALLPYAWMPLVLVLLAIFGVRGTDKNTRGMIEETESAYNYIQVLQDGEYRLLRLNDGQGVHSIYSPNQLQYDGPWEQVLVAPFFNPAPVAPQSVKSMAIVGLAAGTTARQAAAVYPEMQIDGFEIDPKIVEIGRKYFDMNQPNLHVFIQDGRWGLEHSKNSYQIISVDAYRPPYIPWQLTTVEFFQIVRDHLTNDGVLVINVGRSPDDRALINALGSTIGQVFPSVHVMDIPGTLNSILYATAQPTQRDNIIANYAALRQQPGVHPLLMHTLEVTLTNLQPAPGPGPIFTDDHAPIEWITNSMMINFVLSGKVDTLQ